MSLCVYGALYLLPSLLHPGKRVSYKSKKNLPCFVSFEAFCAPSTVYSKNYLIIKRIWGRIVRYFTATEPAPKPSKLSWPFPVHACRNEDVNNGEGISGKNLINIE